MITREITREYVEERNQDWIHRLRGLFAQIEEWRGSLAFSTQLLSEPVLQVEEEILREVGLPPQEIPTYTILAGNRRLAFEPAHLWIVGANGRVNATSNDTQYIMLDMSEPLSGKSDWRVTFYDNTVNLTHFNRDAFHKMCGAAFGLAA